MVLCSFLTSVEFYVVAVIVAAAIVAFSARPAGRGPVVQHLLAGDLTDSGVRGDEQRIELTVNPDNTVILVRRGLRDLDGRCAVSLAIEVKGFDISIKERISMPRRRADVTSTAEDLWPVDAATFTLDFLAPEHYHLHYESPSLNLVAVATLHVRPGIRLSKPLQ